VAAELPGSGNWEKAKAAGVPVMTARRLARAPT